MCSDWLETMLAKWSGDFRNVMLPGTAKAAGEVADAILNHASSLQDATVMAETDAAILARHAKEADGDCDKLGADLDVASALLKEACDFISDERDALFQGHSVNGRLRIECSADRRAAEAIAEMDNWLLRAGKFLNEGGRSDA